MATASRVERWLLVEHDGAWGPESVPMGRLPVETARDLAATAASAGARLLMVRRHRDSPGEAGDPGVRQVFAVDSRPGRERVRRTLVEDVDLVGLRPPYGEAEEPGWDDAAGPLLLVCTHGRHDRCCAVRGRPVAHALAQRWPGTTWECSHVGGDRFAANLIVLPSGLYLGRVEALDVVDQVAGLLEEGRLPAQHVRGRSSLPLPTQAAQGFAREHLGRWGSADLAPVHQEPDGRDRWRVRLSSEDGTGIEVDVVVRYDRSGDGPHSLLTCGAADAKLAAVFRLEHLEVLAPAP